MKNRMIWMVVPALALGVGACKKQEPATPPEAPAAAETAVQETATSGPSAETVSLSPEERAAKLGFVKHLPLDTEVVMAFHNGSKSAQRIQSSKLWKLVQSEMGMGGMPMVPDTEEEMDEDFELPDAEQDDMAQIDPAPDAEPMGPAALFGTEFTLALGHSTGEQTANLLKLNGRMSYFQMRTLAKGFADAAKEGDFSNLDSILAESYGPELFKEMLADPESGIALFEKMNMPPLYLAFRASESNRDAAAQQIAALTENLAMFGEMVVPIETETAGQKFGGYKISGAQISASMAAVRGEMEQMLEPADVDRLLEAVAKKDLVILSGTIGDYVVLFLGASADDLKFAPAPSQSLVSSDALAFCDAYASKELAAVIYGQKSALDKMTAATTGLSDMANGLRDGLAGTEGLGDTRDLETLLRMVADREAALLKLTSNETLGVAAFFEDGLKIESFGGSDSGLVDWKTPNRLASLGDSENTVLFANLTTDAAYDEKARAYLEALMETAYAATMKVAELPVENGDLDQFKQMAGLFDTKFRSDLVAMWDACSGDFGGSLGTERAWIVDLKGSVPTVPGVPQAVIDNGKFPRISMVAPVEDRAKLAASWQSINASLTNVLAKVGEMTGQEIPMQKPVSSEKNGYTTWFFALPFFNDEFMPSVTVGDQWFAASTSKNQALDLLSQAAAGGEASSGLTFSMNFKALEEFSRETLSLLEQNAEALGISPSDLKDVEKVVTALEDLDKLTVHARREGGALRSSIHFKTR